MQHHQCWRFEEDVSCAGEKEDFEELIVCRKNGCSRKFVGGARDADEEASPINTGKPVSDRIELLCQQQLGP